MKATNQRTREPAAGFAVVAHFWVFLSLGSFVCGAEWPVPVQRSTQEVAAVRLAPFVGRATGVSTSGRFVLVDALADPLLESSPAANVLRLDTATGAHEVVGVGLDGARPNGSSLNSRLSEDGGRVVFQSRASNLVAGDTNGSWDVFVRDIGAARTELVSVSSNGVAGAGQSVNPQLSEDGRWVLFESTARDLAPWTVRPLRVFYARDLVSGQTRLVGSGQTNAYVMEDAQLAARAPAVVMRGRFVPPAIYKSGIILEDLVQATNAVVAAFDTADVGPLSVSADGRHVAWCRVDAGTAAGITTNTVECFDAGSGEVVEVARGTYAGVPTIDTALLASAWSADGHWLVYALPGELPAQTNQIVQLFLWDSIARTNRLLTASADGGVPADGHSSTPRISADGSFVVFASEATNLLSQGLSAGRRSYLWDRQSGELSLLSEPSEALGDAEPACDPDGKRAAFAEALSDGSLVVRLTDLGTGTVSTNQLLPGVTQALTRRGWAMASANAASADGRWVAVCAASDEQLTPQVYVVDSVSGERVLISRGSDGSPAASGCWGAQLSADGDRVAFLSAATNLVAGKLTPWVDVFVCSRTTGRFLDTAMAWRGLGVTNAIRTFTLSRDGRWLLVDADAVHLVDLSSGSHSRAPFASLVCPALFSADSDRVALLTQYSAGLPTLVPAIGVFQVSQLASGSTNALWRVGLSSPWEMALSGDGTRVAYLARPFPTPGILSVVNLADGTVVFERPISSMKVAPSLSADGQELVWTETLGLPQIWRADLRSNVTELVSVATDGVSAGAGVSVFPCVSPDGRWVAFASTAANLVPGDGNGQKDVFLRDTLFKHTFLVSRSAAGVGDGWSTSPWFSADGSTLFFISSAVNLAAGDLNMLPDLFTVSLLDAGGVAMLIQPQPGTGKSTLRWSGRSGTLYQLEFKADLGDAWQPFHGAVGADGSVEIDTSGGARFFRVVGP